MVLQLLQQNENLKRQLQQLQVSPPPRSLTLEPLTTPVLNVLDTEFFPYPKYWIKTYHLRPSVVMLLQNFGQHSLNDLMVMAVPMDPGM